MGARLSRQRSREQLVAAPAQGATALAMPSSTSLAADESRVMAAPSTTNRFFRRGGRPLVLAHRGMWQEAQENTVDAIRLALESEADGVEIDVQMTKDGHVRRCPIACFYRHPYTRARRPAGAVSR